MPDLVKTPHLSRVWHIAGKEILQTRRDRLAALFTLVLPVVFTVVLGLIIPGTGEDSRLPLGVVDQDRTAASQQLVSLLEASSLVEIKPTTADAIEKAVQDQKLAGGLVIPQGYQAALDEGMLVTLTLIRLDTLTAAQTVQQAVEEVLSRSNLLARATEVVTSQVAQWLDIDPDPALESAARALVESQLASPKLVLKVTDAKGGSTVLPGGFDQSSTGQLVTWVLFSLLTVTSGLSWERKQGLLRRLSVAGARAREIIAGKMLAMIALTLLQQVFLVALGQFAFGVDYLSSPAALVATMISLSVFASSLGLLIASVFRSEAAVIAVTVIVAQLLAALGGAWFPLEITTSGFSQVANVVPTTWIVRSLHDIVLRGAGISAVLLPLGIVWAWIAVLFSLSVWRFRAASRY